MKNPRIGVLALQGDVREHLRMLTDVGAEGVPIRRPDELFGLDGLILPGGESSTIGTLLVTFELLEPVRKAVASGLPVFGTCAGMILLADRILDGLPDQPVIGGMNVAVRRNAFGRQVDSFEQDVDWVDGTPLRAVFIRAPWVEQADSGVTVLGRADGRIVAVRQGRMLATAFHPEITGDLRVHRMFVDVTRESA